MATPLLDRNNRIKLILDAARSLGAQMQDAPPTWAGDRFNTEALSVVQRGPLPDRTDRDLPRTVIAVTLDTIPVLLGELDAAPNRVRFQDALRRYRNQAMIARSWLGSGAPNLQLFLVGPIGSATDTVWRSLAAEAETDDRVCRKLVWLPPEQATVQDALVFLSRTFLARPWESGPQASSTSLDQMGAITLPAGWEAAVDEAVDDDTLDADALVAKLIELEEGTSP
jgi:hypothetical protein